MAALVVGYLLVVRYLGGGRGGGGPDSHEILATSISKKSIYSMKHGINISLCLINYTGDANLAPM